MASRGSIRRGSDRSDGNSSALSFPFGIPPLPDGTHIEFAGDYPACHAVELRLLRRGPALRAAQPAVPPQLNRHLAGWKLPPSLPAQPFPASALQPHSPSAIPAAPAAKLVAHPQTGFPPARSSPATPPAPRGAHSSSGQATEIENKPCRSAAASCRSSLPYRLPPGSPA